MNAFLGTLLRLSLLGSVGALVLTVLGPLLRRTAGPAAVPAEVYDIIIYDDPDGSGVH